MCDFPGFLCVFSSDFGCCNCAAFYRCFRLNHRLLSAVTLFPFVSNLLYSSFSLGTTIVASVRQVCLLLLSKFSSVYCDSSQENIYIN